MTRPCALHSTCPGSFHLASSDPNGCDGFTSNSDGVASETGAVTASFPVPVALLPAPPRSDPPDEVDDVECERQPFTAPFTLLPVEPEVES